MKKLFLIFLFLASCAIKDPKSAVQENILENLTLSLDTVMVDSKGKLFELIRGPGSSSISEDGKYLFLYNLMSNQIQQINLDELTWEQDYDFEVEGPNGTSDMVLSTKTLGEDKFVITAFNHIGIYNKEGVRLKDLSISSLPISTDLDELDYSILLSSDQKNLFSLPGIRYVGPRTFAKINLQTYELENFPLEEMEWIFDLKIGTSTQTVFQETMYLKEVNNQVLALSPSSSSFYRYDLKNDSLIYHSFRHMLSPEVNENKLKPVVESDQEYQEEIRKFFMGMYFGPLLWEDSKKLYFRFGRKPILSDENHQLIKSEVYLYAYDLEFNLVGEALLPITDRPSDPFFKDGKLWSYVNVEDELGFAVFTFDF
ncbi:DUF4221 family protein [Algoriphagus pacificus]|uniref:DUF4221 family protein n=1 Tax=Algoriphagus pacificus TaxID=2811234 RepID=A0ABS3CDQ4_9BACT|nr:DUF4221 family protein [Algoriphagus pacificus]MBN7814330.1 DUF4221 family protein [Algoriphagus pacificus]